LNRRYIGARTALLLLREIRICLASAPPVSWHRVMSLE
jgi:hypothetical protein